MRCCVAALLVVLAAGACSRRSASITPLVGDTGDTSKTSDTGGSIDGGQVVNTRSPTLLPQDFEVGPVELAKDPYSGPWARRSVVPVRALTVSPALRTGVNRDWKGQGDIIPRIRQPDSPARAVGLLASVGWWRSAPPRCRDAPASERFEYNFSLDGSVYALYFPSDGRGFNFLRNWRVELPLREGAGESFRIDAAMFRAETPNPWGLQACAHLVELEVNHGRGGRGIHFVATALRIVDGTDLFAGRAQEVLESLSRRFDATSRSYRDEILDEYQRVVAQWAGQPPLPSLILDRVNMGPTQLVASWIADAGELEVVLLRSGDAVESTVVGREVIAPSRCPPGAPCAYRETGTFEDSRVWTLRVDFAVRYRVDREARLVSETIYAPRVTFAQKDERRRVSG